MLREASRQATDCVELRFDLKESEGWIFLKGLSQIEGSRLPILTNVLGRGSQVVRPESAKLLYAGSIPARASIIEILNI